MQYGFDHQKYKEQSVNTMTQGEMLILLYEESIKSLKCAKIHAERKDYNKFGENIEKVREIISYLEQTLDRRYPLSADLLKLYEFINFELSRVLASRKPEIIDEVSSFLNELKNTWKEAEQLAKGVHL